MPTVVAPERPTDRPARPARPAVARFRADQLLVDTAHLPDVVGRLWRAGVEIKGATEHPALGTTRLWIEPDERTLLEVVDRTMVGDGLWRAGVVRVNHVFRLQSHWSFVPFDGASASGPRALDGTDVGRHRHVGVIDTGIDRDHPWMDPDYVKAAPSAAISGPPATSFDGLESWEGHGTFVVGLIRQLAPAATIHVAWPGPDAYPARPCASCTRPRHARTVAAGGSVEHADDDDMDGGEIDDVAAAEEILGFGHMQLDVLNLSFGGHTLDPHEPPGVVRSHADTPDDLELGKVVRSVVRGGTRVVASAGNYGTADPVYPAAIRGVTAVGSGTDGRHRDEFSSYGRWVDVWRPGRDAHSSFLMGLEWARWSGTSFAAPRFTGELLS
jgi:subtilisin family serine protease